MVCIIPRSDALNGEKGTRCDGVLQMAGRHVSKSNVSYTTAVGHRLQFKRRTLLWQAGDGESPDGKSEHLRVTVLEGLGIHVPKISCS